jgi:hypothetical protein
MCTAGKSAGHSHRRVCCGRTIPACEAYGHHPVGMVRAALGLTVLPASAKEVRAEPPVATVKRRIEHCRGLRRASGIGCFGAPDGAGFICPQHAAPAGAEE